MKLIIQFITEDLSAFLDNKWIQSVIILIVAFILSKISNKLIKRTIKRKKNITNRLETLFRVFKKLVSFVIYFFAVLQIFQVIFNVQPASLLAATGIFSVALGFGAQSLVKDVISGFFILSEDQFAVGDLVTIESFNGTVHELTLRTTIIRNVSGDLFTIPNGSITKVINHSRCVRGVIVDVSIAYEEDINSALEVMTKVAENAKGDMPSLTEIPIVLGVASLERSGIKLRMLAKCEAGEQFAVERELLKRIKYGFDKENINIPYDHLVLVNKNNSEKN